jgi:heat shock transcription factor
MIHQQIQSIPNFPIPDSQLSNDQFLQWGQNAPPATNPSHPDVDSYPPVSYPGNIEGLQPSNQLARRPANQLVARGRLHDPSLPSLVDQSGVRSDGPGDAGFLESEADLEQRALLAKKDAQAKRKQIPPFVQKLSR